jgi:hypothetical protein
MKLLKEIENWTPYLRNEEKSLGYNKTFQKYYKDEFGKIKYFIYFDYFIYDLKGNNNSEKLIGYASFRNGIRKIEVEYLVDEDTNLKQVEEFFESVWQGMCDKEDVEGEDYRR